MSLRAVPTVDVELLALPFAPLAPALDATRLLKGDGTARLGALALQSVPHAAEVLAAQILVFVAVDARLFELLCSIVVLAHLLRGTVRVGPEVTGLLASLCRLTPHAVRILVALEVAEGARDFA